jgi:hypothetical protein
MVDRAAVGAQGNPGPDIFMDIFNVVLCDPINYSGRLKQILPTAISGGVTKVLEVATEELPMKNNNIPGHVFGLADFLANVLYNMQGPQINYRGIYNQIRDVIGLICLELAFVPRNIMPVPNIPYRYTPYLTIDDFAVTRWDDGTLEVRLLPLPRSIKIRRGTADIPYNSVDPAIYVDDTLKRISDQMRPYFK